MEANDPGSGLPAFAALRALRRRKLYALVPALLMTGAACVYTLRMPERFRAQTLIVAEPPAPGNYLNDKPADATTAIGLHRAHPARAPAAVQRPGHAFDVIALGTRQPKRNRA